jgi:hypothetical protein
LDPENKQISPEIKQDEISILSSSYKFNCKQRKLYYEGTTHCMTIHFGHVREGKHEFVIISSFLSILQKFSYSICEKVTSTYASYLAAEKSFIAQSE